MISARPLLYLETSIFGFYFDPSPVNRHRREAVKTLFRQIAGGDFTAVTSELTVRRINAVNLREGYPLLSIRTPEEVIRYED
jgi:hypothetical protein